MTDKDIDEMLDKLRAQHTEWKDVDRASQDKDQITIDFVGSIDGDDATVERQDDKPIKRGQANLPREFIVQELQRHCVQIPATKRSRPR